MRGLKLGGREGDRTLGLRIANAALSQLSYSPTAWYRRGSGYNLIYQPEEIKKKTITARCLLRHRMSMDKKEGGRKAALVHDTAES
jgi:hypothetical protein